MRVLINRQDAIDALTEDKEMINAVLDSLTLDYNTRRDQEQRRGQINEDIETIKALPSAQSEQRWIPCSERLPDMWDERYLVSLAWGGIGVMEYKSTGFHTYGSFTPVPIESITAWMPLPEPYAERRTDEGSD